jgi:phospholipase C
VFGAIDPPSNRGVPAEQMVAPYNAPADPDQVPTMSGFVTDYLSAFTAELGRQPTYDEYRQIMTGYTPEQLPVLSALARGFAVFDQWFADVPSQTFTNRSFFHAGTASGLVVNAPYANFPVHNTAETLFDRLERHGLTWKVCCDPPSIYSLTGLIHAPRLRERFATHFFSTDQFFADADQGELPTYAFIEPQIIGHGHKRHAPRLQHAHARAQLGPAVLAARRRGPPCPDLCRGSVIVVPGRVELVQHAVHGRLR